MAGWRSGWIVGTVLACASPAAAQTVPSAEAVALGRHVAENGTLGTLLPVLTAKDVDELVAAHPELDAAARTRLRVVATATARKAGERLMTALGMEYARRLSLVDLRALAAFADTPAAQARRVAEPGVIAASMAALAGFDLKQAGWAAYCAAPASACPPAK